MKKTIYNLAQVALVLIATTMFTSCSLFHHDDDDVLKVTPMDLSLGGAKGEISSFRITANTMWTISGQADWLSVSAHSGDGDTEIMLETLSANKTERERSVTLLIQGEKQSQSVTVTQLPGSKSLYVSMSNPVILSDGFFAELAFDGDIKGFYYECYYADRVRAYTDDAFVNDLRHGEPLSPQNYKYADYILPSPNTNYVFVAVAYNSQYEFGPLLKYEFTSKSDFTGYDAYVGNFKRESSRWTFDVVKEVYCDSYYAKHVFDDSNGDYATTYAYYYKYGYLSSAFFASLIDDEIRANSIQPAKEGGSLQLSRRKGQDAIFFWTWGQNASRQLSGNVQFAYCGSSSLAPQVNRQSRKVNVNDNGALERMKNKPTTPELEEMAKHVMVANL